MARPKKSILKKKKTAKPVLKKSKKSVAKKLVSKPAKKKVAAIPKGYSSVIPYLISNHAAKAIDFYKKVFGAKERMRMEHNKKVGHAELKIGDSLVMLADECPEKGALCPNGGTGVSIHLYVKNVDAVFEKAVAAGAKIIREVEDMFYGDRNGIIQDPFGHTWCISTHVENVTPAKMKKRAQALFADAASNE